MAPAEAEVAPFDLAHLTIPAMEDDALDIMHLQIGTDAIEVAGHALQDDVAVAEEGVVVQFLPVGVEVRPAQLIGTVRQGSDRLKCCIFAKK